MITIKTLGKTRLPRARKFAAILAALFLMAAGGLTTAAAQTESVLYSFAGGTADGANPWAGLTIDGSGNLFGAASSGGANGAGVVFELASGATNDTILCNLPDGTGGINGAHPTGTPAIDSSGNIYGTAAYNDMNDGGSGDGVVYECAPNGSGGYTYSVLHNFTGVGTDGANPFAGVTCDTPNTTCANLYGTTVAGGSTGHGTIYKQPVGGTFAPLYSFTGGNDGWYPWAGVTLIGSSLYGTTVEGGASDNGTMYTEPVSGGLPTTLYAFPTTSKGIFPRGGLILDSEGNIYGTTWFGGNVANDGVVFQNFSLGGGNYQYYVLHTFTGGTSDGASPWSGLFMDSSGNLYGTTNSGGASGYGTVFELSPDGSGGYNETILHSFGGGTGDGANPYAGLIADSAGNLYGTTLNGGASGDGVIFEISLAAAKTRKH